MPCDECRDGTNLFSPVHGLHLTQVNYSLSRISNSSTFSWYVSGDIGFAFAGGAGGAALGIAECGGPETPVGWACGVAGGIAGSGVVHWLFGKMF